MRRIVVSAGLAAVLALAGCEGEPEETRPTDAEEVATAGQQYHPATFDTVSWESQQAAIERGRDIYTWACAECHGEDGRGEAGRVIDGDTIQPASFQRADWEYADNPEALHRKVFVGNTLGMPHWGLRQMRPRDVVAVEQYIRLELVRNGEEPAAEGEPGSG